MYPQKSKIRALLVVCLFSSVFEGEAQAVLARSQRAFACQGSKGRSSRPSAARRPTS